MAVEPDNIRYWHLLGLLLAASKDWRGAREVLEAGATLDDQAWVAEQTSSPANDLPDSNTTKKVLPFKMESRGSLSKTQTKRKKRINLRERKSRRC
jgi:hypothetical protein